MPPRVHGGDRRWFAGGILTYATDSLFEEIAYVAYHFHWPFQEILDLEHPVRRRFVDEIAGFNRRLTGEE
jgi:hypothetical protein